MRFIRSALWSANAVLSRQFQSSRVVRPFSATPLPISEEWDRANLSESLGESEQGNDGVWGAFYKRLEKVEKAQERYGIGEGLGENFNSLSDGMDMKLKKVAAYFEFDPLEVTKDDYSFRPDVNFQSGMTYDIKDLDLRKPGVHKPKKRFVVETTTEEVLREADFRNVKFLANFITEAGIINKRSNTEISAKAQRKVARGIKTARAFGLMPFTTMGTKQFKFGDTMEDMDCDFEFESSFDHNFVDDRASV